jgi:hypothetical protein
MESFSKINAMLSAIGTMATWTNNFCVFWYAHSQTIGYFHSSRRDAPFLLPLKVFQRGKIIGYRLLFVLRIIFRPLKL